MPINNEDNPEQAGVRRSLATALFTILTGSAERLFTLSLLVTQIVAIAWYVSSFTTAVNLRIDNLEKRVNATANIPEKLAALETQARMTNELLVDIRGRLQQHLDQGNNYGYPHK